MSADLESATRAYHPFDVAEGVRPPSVADGRHGFLSDVIIELGFAQRDVVEDSVDQSRLLGKVAEDLLVEAGAITDEQLSIAIAERNGLPYVDLFTFSVDDEAARLIGSDTARRYRALPIAFDADGAIVVALTDPLDALAVSDIGVITKSEVRIAVATDAGIEALLRTLPTTPPSPVSRSAVAAASTDEWTLTRSISHPQPGSEADPTLDRTLAPPVPAPPPPATAPAGAELEGRIEALVAAALAKHLDTAPAAPAAPPPAADEINELAVAEAEAETARQEAARMRDAAEQARAEVEALSARIEQLEGGSLPAPPPLPSPDEESPFGDQFARVMREHDEPGH